MNLRYIVGGAQSLSLNPNAALTRKDMVGRFVMHHRQKSPADDRQAIQGDWRKAINSAGLEIKRLETSD